MDSLLPPNHPTLFMGSLNEAVQYAKSSYKFLVIYLHSDLHQDTQQFVNQVFCDQTVLEILNRNFVVWAGDVSLPGPHLASLQLPVDGFPALCVMSPLSFVPRSHSNFLTQANIRLPLQLYRLADTCNNTNTEDVVHLLSGVVEQYAGWITAVKRTQREAEANRQLLQDQDQAYLDALAADEARAREEEEAQLRREEETRRIAEEERLANEEREAAERQAEREAANRAAELTASRERAANRLGDEPQEGAENVISVTFRTIESSRITRRFLNSDTVELLYDFCRTLPSTPTNFSLLIPYPRRTLSNMQQSLRELNINKAILTIEPA